MREMAESADSINTALAEIGKWADSLQFREQMLDSALTRLEYYTMGLTVFLAVVSLALAVLVWRYSLVGSRAAATDFFKDQGDQLVDAYLEKWDKIFADEVRKFHSLGPRVREGGTPNE
jgi:hypothetical protein